MRVHSPELPPSPPQPHQPNVQSVPPTASRGLRSSRELGHGAHFPLEQVESTSATASTLIDWSKPSTSAIPYSPPPSSSFRTFSTSAHPSASKRRSASPEPLNVHSDPFATLEATLAQTSTADERTAALPSLVASFDALLSDSSPLSGSTIPRTTFDHLFSRVAALPSSDLSFSLAVLKRLQSFASQHDWPLELWQTRALLRVRVEKDEQGRLKRVRRFGPEAEVNVGKGNGRTARGVREKREYLDWVADEYARQLNSGGGHVEDAELLERYALAVANRLPPSPSPASDASARAAQLALARRSSGFLLRSLSLRPPPADNAIPSPSPVASLPLRFLFCLDDHTTALSHLLATLEHNYLPSVSTIRTILNSFYGELDAATSTISPTLHTIGDEDAYAQAKQLLDEVCSDPCPRRREAGESQLDALLRLRLERVERAETLEATPHFAFIDWLVGDFALQLEKREESLKVKAIEAAMRVWEASQVKEKDEWRIRAKRFSRSRAAKVLVTLARQACARSSVEAFPTAARLAVELCTQYLPQPLLIHDSVTLLRAATSTDQTAAFALFEALIAPPPPHVIAAIAAGEKPYSPFSWTTSLLPSFTSLFLSSASSADPALPLRLYHSWTASGLSFPIGLWNPLWRAAGRRGDVDELARLVEDWEETGRGPVSSRIIQVVISAAAELPIPVSSSSSAASAPLPTSFTTPDSTASTTTSRLTVTQGRILAPLRLLSFFRSRYCQTPSSPPPPPLLHPSKSYLLIPPSAYLSVLRSLSRSHLDRRSAFRQVWRQMLMDSSPGRVGQGVRVGVGAYNAAIAVNVWRPGPWFTVRDLDAAGVVYNELVAAAAAGGGRGGPQPNRETFSLLLHGFLRIATSPHATKRRKHVVLEGALRTFSAACRRGTGVRGHQAARLVRTLAERGRWEEGKRCQEEWWRVLVAVERSWNPWEGGEREGKAQRARDMWEDREIKAEVREMRWVREECERLERGGSTGREKGHHRAGEEEVKGDLEGEREDAAASSEVFEVVELLTPPSDSATDSPSHPHDTPLHN
ncbi:hypothetical protein JCM11641_002014 [Rhodosporidiobolus odoratus]